MQLLLLVWRVHPDLDRIDHIVSLYRTGTYFKVQYSYRKSEKQYANFVFQPYLGLTNLDECPRSAFRIDIVLVIEFDNFEKFLRQYFYSNITLFIQ